MCTNCWHLIKASFIFTNHLKQNWYLQIFFSQKRNWWVKSDIVFSSLSHLLFLMCYQLDLNGEMVTDSHCLWMAENIAERFFSSFAKRIGKRKIRYHLCTTGFMGLRQPLCWSPHCCVLCLSSGLQTWLGLISIMQARVSSSLAWRHRPHCFGSVFIFFFPAYSFTDSSHLLFISC